MTSAAPAANWFPDPEDASQLRWWDGNSWTEHRHPVAPPAPPTAVSPVPIAAQALAPAGPADANAITVEQLALQREQIALQRQQLVLDEARLDRRDRRRDDDDDDDGIFERIGDIARLFGIGR